MLKHGIAAAAAAVVLCGPALAAGVPAGAGQTVFRDVPVAPGSFPDYGPSHFMLRGGAHARPQAFNYGNGADAAAMYAWYERQLPQRGWHIEQRRRNYPTAGADALVASRRGEAVTIVVTKAGAGSKVSVIKLVSTQ